MSEQQKQTKDPRWLFCVAPMLDWTDRHCRVFHRQLSQHARLYTEMVTTGALRHGDVSRHLDFSDIERPLALQIGGSEVADLAHAAKLAKQWGYDEINLNCGCPSERVQKGAFGACLMKEPRLVADGLKAMQDAADITVTVKHRIGVDDHDNYDFVRDFVGQVNQHSGVNVFIVHARKALLKGLSPKENRSVPPLNYDTVRALKRDFPQLTFVLNGGLTEWPMMCDLLGETSFDGVMVGRAAYQNPWLLHEVDSRLFGKKPLCDSREQVMIGCEPYLQSLREQGLNLHLFTRHVLGLFNGEPSARRWRQTLSDRTFINQASAQDIVALAREITNTKHTDNITRTIE
jgi:tRNA-dihydrouridine synthase A